MDLIRDGFVINASDGENALTPNLWSLLEELFKNIEGLIYWLTVR